MSVPGKNGDERGAACQLMRRDESAPGRTRASSLLAVQFWATWREHMEALCLEHLCQTLSYWSQFSQEQADRGFLRRTTTQVITPGESDRNGFSRAGGTKSHWLHQGSPRPGEWGLCIQNPDGLGYVQRRNRKSFLAKSIFSN